MDAFLSKEKFEQEVQVIEQNAGRRLEAYLKVVKFCHQVLERYQIVVAKEGFADLASEVYFFKHQKQIPQEALIYYSLLKAHELEVPSGDALRQEYLRTKMLSIHNYFSANLEFVQYIEMDANYLDEVYWVVLIFIFICC